MTGYRILLADDYRMAREGLRALLEKAGHEVVAEAADGHEALALAGTCHPDVVVLDIAMPRLNGLDVARELLRLSPQRRIVLLTMYTERHYVTNAVRIGIKGYVLKSQAAEDLLHAIREVMRGASYLSPSVMSAVVGAHLLDEGGGSATLTRREREVLQLIAEGRSTKQIARDLGISYKTAESHRTHMMKKLDIHEVASLVRYAIRRGLLRA